LRASSSWRLSGPAPLTPVRSGRSSTTPAIVAAVKAKITADRLSNLVRIDVKSNDGVVTLTLADGRVLGLPEGAAIWQSSTLQELKPGTPVLIRNVTPAVR
jgi:hypothetical protein